MTHEEPKKFAPENRDNDKDIIESLVAESAGDTQRAEEMEERVLRNQERQELSVDDAGKKEDEWEKEERLRGESNGGEWKK